MTYLVGRLSTMLRGRGGVPTTPGQMGPVQPKAGIFSDDNLELLSTGLNLASAGSVFFGARDQARYELARANQEARALDFSAQESDIEANREEVRGKQDANNIMEALRQTLAAQRVAFAGNGVDTGFGTPIDVMRDTSAQARRQLTTARSDAQAGALARRRQAAATREESINTRLAGRQSAKNTKRTGAISAMGTVADLVQRRIERG